MLSILHHLSFSNVEITARALASEFQNQKRAILLEGSRVDDELHGEVPGGAVAAVPSSWSPLLGVGIGGDVGLQVHEHLRDVFPLLETFCRD